MLARIENGTNYLYAFDGNGNVDAVVGDAGTVVARYTYDPFGRTVAQSGAYAAANPWRFSTKQTDNWGLYYYGSRFYEPSLGRWPNRDPLGEMAFRKIFIKKVNRDYSRTLYVFCANNSVESIDLLGLARVCCRTLHPA